MTITAGPDDRLGENVVLTITEPVQHVQIMWNARRVKVEMNLLRRFAQTYDDDYGYRTWLPPFSFEQERALIQCGYAVVGGGGSLRPSRALVMDVAEWDNRHR
jgi:hypothetical protein